MKKYNLPTSIQNPEVLRKTKAILATIDRAFQELKQD